MKIPKGGLHNINQSSQANINDSWNVLATDENNAVLIAVDKCGTKKTVGDTTEIKNSIQALEQENIEQDNRLNLVEQENQNQNTLISELIDDVTNLEGIHYTWSPTNRTLTLYDNNGNQLSQVSLVSLDNEGTDLRYNSSTLSLELYNADNELLDSIPVSSFIGSVGTQLQLNSNQLQLRDSQGNILSTVSFSVINIPGLQTALDSKLNKGSYPGNASDLKTEIDGKLNKPTTTSNTTSYPYVVGENGNGGSARLPAGDLGKNFFNSDLSNTTARNHTMNAGVTVNTLGNLYAIKGLLDKTNNTTYSKGLALNPTTGEVVTKDNADPTDVTNAINAANATQKTSMRTALLGTATPANPVINDISKGFIPVDTYVYSDIFGINLTMLDPSYIYITDPNNSDPNTNKILASSFYNKSSQAVTVLWYIPNSIPDGSYPIKIQNASTVQGASNGVLTIVRNINTNLKPTNWIKHLRINPSTGNEYPDTAGTSWQSDFLYGQIYNSNIADANSGTLNDVEGIVAIKSNNFLPANKDWEFRMILTNKLAYSGSQGFPFIGVTSLEDSNFISLTSLNTNNNYFKRSCSGVFISESNATLNNGNNNPHYIIFTKRGNNLYAKLYKDDINGVTILYNQWIGTIDGTKNYAIWLKLYANVNTGISWQYDYGITTV